MTKIIIAFALVAVIFLIVLAIDICSAFHLRRCQHCKHIMSHAYKKEHEGITIHVFHCPHCDTWEEISETQLLDSIH